MFMNIVYMDVRAMNSAVKVAYNLVSLVAKDASMLDAFGKVSMFMGAWHAHGVHGMSNGWCACHEQHFEVAFILVSLVAKDASMLDAFGKVSMFMGVMACTWCA
jgi:hypothetical protein